MATKVLHVFYGDNIAGGGSYSMLYLCEGLQQLDGFEVQAVVPRTREREMSRLLEECDLKVYDLEVPWLVHAHRPQPSVKDPIRHAIGSAERMQTDREIARIIEHEHIDLVHIGGAVVDAGLRPALKAGAPVVWHFREFVERDHGLVYYDKPAAFAAYARASQCITVSEAVADYYRGLLPGTPIDAVYNGMLPASELDALATMIGKRPAPEGVWRMAFFGGVSETKGTFELIRGLAEFKSQGGVAFKLDIYGRATPDALARMRNLVASNGLEGLVKYKGWTKVDSELLSGYDISFTCSRAEAFGRVTADAMCNGVLVIGANTGGTRELVEAGGGCLYSAGDSASLAQAVDDVTSGRVDYSAEVGKAYRFAREHFSREAYVANVAAIYRRVLDDEHSHRGDD